MNKLFLFFVTVALFTAVSAPSFAAPDRNCPAKVIVGLYLNQLRELDLKTSRFEADFWLWFRWKGEDVNPSRSFEIVGGSYSLQGEPIESAGEGFRYASMRVRAVIYQPFDVGRFPLDDHWLQITIEDNQNEAHKLAYAADVENSRVDPGVDLPGWIVDHTAMNVTTYSYRTNYGDVSLPSGSISQYSRFAFQVHIRRPGTLLFWKLFWGLLIATSISILCLFISPLHLDARFGLCVGSLFASVASAYG